nr:zinc ribbon domain-containing protein [uncultured Methanobrevibacter sp.]
MSKYCPSCGEELVDNAKFCKSCGMNLENMEANRNVGYNQQFNVPIVEKDHKVAIIAGYVLAVLIPLLGIIVSVYLLTRNTENAKRHGKYVLIVAVIVWIISFILL